jgi:hypothetical protein
MPTLSDLDVEPDGDERVEVGRSRVRPIDWATFLTRDLGEVDWLAGRLVARGQQAALVGKGKAGKSLLALEWAWRAAAGLPFLGGARPPLSVLYVDRENSDDDIQERLLSFGATVEELANLRYVQFPHYRPLDTREGGEDLLADVEEYASGLVFLDTVSRYVRGKENDSDTWLDLYRYTLARLKSRRVACVRLDHFGKDAERGSRGSSAKEQDIDAVWELTEQPGGLLRLQRTHTRNGHGEGDLMLRRHGSKVAGRWKAGETRHELTVQPEPAQPGEPSEAAKALAVRLAEAGIPATWGRERVGKRCAELKIATGGNVTLSEAIKYRKAHPNLSVNLSADDDADGQVSRTGLGADRLRTGRTKPQATPVRDSLTDRSRTGESGPVRAPLPLYRGEQEQGSTQHPIGEGFVDRFGVGHDGDDEIGSCVGCFSPTDRREPDGAFRCERCTGTPPEASEPARRAPAWATDL